MIISSRMATARCPCRARGTGPVKEETRLQLRRLGAAIFPTPAPLPTIHRARSGASARGGGRGPASSCEPGRGCHVTMGALGEAAGLSEALSPGWAARPLPLTTWPAGTPVATNFGGKRTFLTDQPSPRPPSPAVLYSREQAQRSPLCSPLGHPGCAGASGALQSGAREKLRYTFRVGERGQRGGQPGSAKTVTRPRAGASECGARPGGRGRCPGSDLERRGRVGAEPAGQGRSGEGVPCHDEGR